MTSPDGKCTRHVYPVLENVVCCRLNQTLAWGSGKDVRLCPDLPVDMKLATVTVSVIMYIASKTGHLGIKALRSEGT